MGRRHAFGSAALACAAIALSSCARTPPPRPGTLSIAGRSSANASLAADGDVVAAAWGAYADGGGTDIYAAVSHDAGATFGAPVRVSGGEAPAQISGEQPPRVSLLARGAGDPSIVVVWTAKGSDGTRLLTARSDDGGRSFGRATIVAGSDAAGNRGWESTTVDRGGHVDALWLDHRALAGAPAMSMPMNMPMHHDGMDHSAHAAASDGVAKAELSKLYFGRIDGSVAARALTGGVCYCCKTAFATGADGALYAAWRHVYPGDIRDIAFTMSRDDGRTFAAPVRVSEDHWVLDGCPENGPAMAIGPQGRIHLIWPTLVSGADAGGEPTLALFYSFSGDGVHFSARQRLATEGTPGHVQMAIASGDRSLLVVWDEVKDGTRRAVAAKGMPDGNGAMRFTRDASVPGASYPVVAATARGFVWGWTDTASMPQAIEVRIAR
jgi:hypothetical protein